MNLRKDHYRSVGRMHTRHCRTCPRCCFGRDTKRCKPCTDSVRSDGGARKVRRRRRLFGSDRCPCYRVGDVGRSVGRCGVPGRTDGGRRLFVVVVFVVVRESWFDAPDRNARRIVVRRFKELAVVGPSPRASSSSSSFLLPRVVLPSDYRFARSLRRASRSSRRQTNVCV